MPGVERLGVGVAIWRSKNPLNVPIDRRSEVQFGAVRSVYFERIIDVSETMVSLS